MKKSVLILLGGRSAERKISFLTGKACSKALKKKGYRVKELDAKGYFIEKLKRLKPKLVFNALHGKYGEDGFIQIILEYFLRRPSVVSRQFQWGPRVSKSVITTVKIAECWRNEEARDRLTSEIDLIRTPNTKSAGENEDRENIEIE